MDQDHREPPADSTEIWEIHNFTMDAHPIHLHLVEVRGGRARGLQGMMRDRPNRGRWARPRTRWSPIPDEITRVKAIFDIAGLYVWHCHILDHEDNEMMRPYDVVKALLDKSFPDVPMTHPFHEGITYLAARGIVEGYANGFFGPDDSVRRAQLAKMIILALGKHDVNTIVGLAAGRGLAVELAAVPGREAGLAHRPVVGDRDVALAEDDIGLVRSAVAQRLDAWLGVGPLRQVGRAVGAGPVASRARRRAARAGGQQRRGGQHDPAGGAAQRGGGGSRGGSPVGVTHGAGRRFAALYAWATPSCWPPRAMLRGLHGIFVRARGRRGGVGVGANVKLAKRALEIMHLVAQLAAYGGQVRRRVRQFLANVDTTRANPGRT